MDTLDAKVCPFNLDYICLNGVPSQDKGSTPYKFIECRAWVTRYDKSGYCSRLGEE